MTGSNGGLQDGNYLQLATAQLMSSYCVLLTVSLAGDLGRLAARLQRLQLDTRLLQQQNTKELWDSAVCMHSWCKFRTQKIQRDQKTQLPLLSSLEQK